MFFFQIDSVEKAVHASRFSDQFPEDSRIIRIIQHMTRDPSGQPAVSPRVILLFGTDFISRCRLGHFGCNNLKIRTFFRRGFRNVEQSRPIGQHMPYFHILFAFASEFRPEIRNSRMIGQFAHFHEPMNYSRRRCFPGRKDRENGIFIHLLGSCPVRPTGKGIDLEFPVYEQSRLTAAFGPVFHGLIKHFLNFFL